ncbi:hypothetical protein [Paraflavitalea speifideaquila]|uniref:hypothetical protein n=1 Tax=Paraflavitalea speifideaquila TaxID=3076558 RepID=UPI0028EDF62A|nr:hypothetical protein [Paraflavitalea speifideiaquila]
MVERAVSLVYQRIYYPLSRHTFFSIEELNQHIAYLLEQYNDYLFAHGGTTRRQQFIDTEKQWLQPLPQGRYHLRQYKRAKVKKTCHIYLSEAATIIAFLIAIRAYVWKCSTTRTM